MIRNGIGKNISQISNIMQLISIAMEIRIISTKAGNFVRHFTYLYESLVFSIMSYSLLSLLVNKANHCCHNGLGRTKVL